jgi:hypothetical protein
MVSRTSPKNFSETALHTVFIPTSAFLCVWLEACDPESVAARYGFRDRPEQRSASLAMAGDCQQSRSCATRSTAYDTGRYLEPDMGLNSLLRVDSGRHSLVRVRSIPYCLSFLYFLPTRL